MAERQESHRQYLEKTVIESDKKRAALGLWLGFILALVFGVGAIYLVSIGQSLEGLATIFATVGTLVGAFIYGQISRKRERLEQRKREEKRAEKLEDNH